MSAACSSSIVEKLEILPNLKIDNADLKSHIFYGCDVWHGDQAIVLIDF